MIPANHQGKTGIVGSLFKAKRRASQAIREKIGTSKNLTNDLDADKTYNTLYEELLTTEKEFDALGASFGQFAANLEMWTRASRDLAGGAHRFFSAASETNSNVDPSFVKNVTTFEEAAVEVDDNIRRHVTKEYMDHVLSPLKQTIFILCLLFRGFLVCENLHVLWKCERYVRSPVPGFLFLPWI